MKGNSNIYFQCPKWSELPDKSLFNREVVAFINRIFQQIIDDDVFITSTMIQNYSKWQMIPKMQGRKYHKEHIAYLIVLTAYKQVMQLDDVKQGAALLLKLMEIEEGYNRFAQSLERSVNGLLDSVRSGGQLTFEGQTVEKNSEGLQVLSNAVALKLFGTIIIRENGLQRLKEKYHV